MLDVVGVSVALAAWFYRPDLTLMVLPTAIAAQYCVSCLYHWLPYNETRRALDHLMIAVLISATYAQFWIASLRADEALWRIGIVGTVTLAILILRVAVLNHSRLRGTLYVVLTLGGLALSLLEPSMLTLWAWVGFLSGIALYGLQFLIYTLQKPDLVPQLFGFRELQHVVLLAASSLHLIVAVTCL